MVIRKGSVTVKIYCTVDRGRPRFSVSFHEGAQRRLRQFADETEARAEAKLIAERLNAGQGDALALTGKDRDAYLFAVQKLKPFGMSLSTAIQEYLDAKAVGAPLVEAAKFFHRAHLQALPSRTIPQLVDDLLAAKAKDGASRAYLNSLRSYGKTFSRDFQLAVADVTTSDLDAWLRALDVSPRSRNNFRNNIVLIFNFARSAGFLPRDISTAAEATSLARKKESEIEVFTPSEITKLLAVADEVALPFLVLGGFVGLRSAEILRLEWRDIRWRERVVEVRSSVSKTRTRRLPPLTPAALSWLTAFRNRTGTVIPSADTARGALERAGKDAGVAWKKNALRHSFGTYRMAVTQDAVRVSHEMGNSPAIVKEHYDRVVTKVEGRRWFAIRARRGENIIQLEAAF